MEIARKFGPAVASLAAAIALWFVVHNLDRSPARFTVPITYEAGSDVVVLSDRVTEVEIQVRATKPKLRSLQAAAFVVKVRHPTGRFGREFVVLDAGDVEAPFGVTVERVTPSQFWVTYDRRVTRPLPVQLDVEGRPAAGRELATDEMRVRPAEVMVSGPESLFTGRLAVRSERIDISGRKESLQIPRIPLVPPGPSFTIERPADVEAMIPIRPVRLRRTFEEVPVEVVAGTRKVSRPNPRSIRVTVEGNESELTDLSLSAVHAQVDASELDPRDEDYHLEPDVTVDGSACPSCRIVGRSQGRIDITVSGTKRSGRRTSFTEGAPAGAPASVGKALPRLPLPRSAFAPPSLAACAAQGRRT